MKKIKVLIDNGHGENTPGKHSPDFALREYKWAREMARMIERELSLRGIDCIRIVTEENDIGLTERCRRVNAWCDKLGSQNVVLVSIHNNAAGNGSWYNARGWLCIVDDSASQNAKKFADLLFDEIASKGLKTRQAVPNRKWYLYRECVGGAKRLTILKGTKCPAVLTENFFQDNQEDVRFLLSDEGKKQIRDAHVNAILKYINSL